MPATQYKIGKCRWCENRGEVFRDSLLCDDCDGNIIRCSICRTDYHCQSCCRHVFQDRNFEWRGAGVHPYDPELEVPFHRLLAAMPDGFAVDLKAAIRSGRFFTWMIAPLIGGGGILELNGMPDRRMVHGWGDALIKLGDRAELADGYHWLASLYKRSTTKANRTTLLWIDRFLWPLSRIEQRSR